MKFPVHRLALAAAGCLLALTACAPPNTQPAVNAAVPPPPPATTTAAGAPGTLTEANLTETPFGPISPTDRKLLTIVQQTSLREITTSIWAEQRSTNPAVQAAARTIITQHKDLEARDTDISTRMGLDVPTEPAPDMQAGINRMSGEFGGAFERDYVNTLRKAHAEALILVSTVRADTRNTLVRPFADLAGDYIKTHINLLEKTGDVDYAQLPVPAL